jgi:hypothetical protein
MRNILLLLAFLSLAALISCSSHSSPVAPSGRDNTATNAADSHQLWGMWRFAADPERGTLDIVPLRISAMHLNALPFLEPPPFIYLSLESLEFNGNIIEANIGIRHPFLGLIEFTGFDVCGILITNGSITGFDDAELIMAGEGDTRLLNPDGWSRWWNPAEFPHDGTMFGYKDGLLGTPDSVADYNSTLNAYKFFCDDIELPNDPVSEIDMSSRCVFSAGQKNIRHYTIELGAGLVFNYAVDASWEFPTGSPPWMVPDSFGPNANRVEAWNISITETDNTLWNDGAENGGDLSLLIDVWDHFDAGMNTVKVESPGNFDVATSATPIGGGDGYSTYEIEIIDATPSPDSIDLLITVESEAVGYQDLLPGKTVSAYFMHTSAVAQEPQGPPECGTGIYTTVQQTPFTDHGGEYTLKLELAWLVNGPYAGQMLVNVRVGTSLTIRRYDMDNIEPHSGALFATLPPGACPADPSPFLFHMEVEPETGRVIVVPNGLGVNHSMLIYDNAGNLISSTSGISVGAYRKIMAMDANENGDLWLLTVYSDPTGPANLWIDSRLERWAYQGGPPYYAYDGSFNLPLDEIIGVYNDKTGEWYVLNNIIDLVILYPEQRMFVFQSTTLPDGEHNGKLYVFDVNADSPPTYRDDLSKDGIFPYPVQCSFTDNMKATSSAIWCDHSDPELDGCRVIVYARRHFQSPQPLWPMLVRLDRDANVLNENIMSTNTFADTIGVNEDPDPTKAHLVWVDYDWQRCYMSTPPADW